MFPMTGSILLLEVRKLFVTGRQYYYQLSLRRMQARWSASRPALLRRHSCTFGSLLCI